MGFPHDGIGIAVNIDGQTVVFMGDPGSDAALRKEMLGIAKSAKFLDK